MEESYEERHVHSVYSSIASHFSSTRYKSWPNVASFLHALPQNSIVLDAGCGNGKYLGTRSLVHSTTSNVVSDILPESDEPTGPLFMIGADRSMELLSIARSRGFEVFRADVGQGFEGCFRRQTFDAAISIATIHHFTTHRRRLDALKALMLPVCPNKNAGTNDTGRVLVHVWALEQSPAFFQKPHMEPANLKTPDLDSTEEDAKANNSQTVIQDWMVPWTLQTQTSSRGIGKGEGKGKGKKLEGKPERDEPRVFKRFYHLFKQGELEGLAKEVADELGWEFTGWEEKATSFDLMGKRGIRILNKGWEKDNWFVDLLLFDYTSTL